jgi:3-deoxy-7-phosphoheptulonate synthase
MTPYSTQMSKPNTDDVRIKEIKELVPPAHVFREYPLSNRAAQTTYTARQAIHRILHGADDRLLVVIGPCSIHDYDLALDYAKKLAKEAEKHADDLVILMRVYFEKPRTTVGWKGLINDPRLDNTFRINEGIRLARKILLEINEMDLPCATEFLDTITPQYTADLIAWGAIGARTTSRRSIVSWLPVYPARSVSRTVPTATCGLPLMPFARPIRRTISSR